MSLTPFRCVCLIASLLASSAFAAPTTAPATTPATKPAFVNPLNHPDQFPIAVWLQDPGDADAYKSLGVNLFIGLWKGPTEDQLRTLEAAGMPVICHQNAFARQNLDRKIIIGWMHDDEPDNAQPTGHGYGPPVPPATIQADYARMKKSDPTRPVLLNLGQGAAWDGWNGRGVRSNHPEDYPQYLKGCDIASFDIYPVVHSSPQVSGKLWMVPGGVQRMRKWCDDKKIIWNCIETTHISNPAAKPTPRQVRAEVWMSIIAGSRGIIYFCHEFSPNRDTRMLLHDDAMATAVKQIDEQIASLAPAINAAAPKTLATVKSSEKEVPISLMTRSDGKATYVFAAAMHDGLTMADFTLPGASGSVEVLGEDRTLPIESGKWQDKFDDYDVHLYRVK